jgi:hypothetical protein
MTSVRQNNWGKHSRLTSLRQFLLIIVVGSILEGGRRNAAVFYVDSFMILSPVWTYAIRTRRCLTLVPNGGFEDDDNWNLTASSATVSDSQTDPVSKGVYRRIEDWHHENHDPNHVIKHLKREQARWASAFEDLWGDGI